MIYNAQTIECFFEIDPFNQLEKEQYEATINLLRSVNFLKGNIFVKWRDKSTTSYDMLDFKSYIKNL